MGCGCGAVSPTMQGGSKKTKAKGKKGGSDMKEPVMGMNNNHPPTLAGGKKKTKKVVKKK